VVRRGHAAAVSGEGPGATDVRASGAQRALCDRTTLEMRGLSLKIISGILDETRMYKHIHISIQYHI
jgi:hypothetical protein